MNSLLRIGLLGYLLLVGACAAITSPPPADWAAQQSQLQKLNHFSARGKIALRTPEQAESASLHWQQMGEATHLRLQGPLGIAATTVDSDGEIVEIRRGEDHQRWASDAVPAGTPWDLPLQSLPYWLRGIPAPGTPTDELEFAPDTGLPRYLSQQGWNVEYSDFGVFAGYRLPTRLEVSRDGTRARIILRRWENLAADD